MWILSSTNRHSLLILWSRKLHTSVAVSHHITGRVLGPEDSMKPAVRKRPTWSNKHSVKHKFSEPGRILDSGSPAESKSGENEATQNKSNFRVSSELRKLRLEDFPSDNERQLKQNFVLDSKSETFEVVYGIAPCLLALTQGRRKALQLFVKNGETAQRASVLKVCEEARGQGVPVSRVTKRDLDKMSSGGVHQGVCLHASPLSYLTEDHTPARGPNTPLWLILERIQDPMNLGAILRSAYFLGVDRVVSSIRSSCPLSPVVSKSSSGVMEVMGVFGYENLEHLVKVKQTQGWEVVGTIGANTKDSQIQVTKCSDFQMTKPTLLLMGGEGEGLSKQLLSLCDTLLTIPAGRDLYPGIESLNVSVASGILLHSLLLTRRTASSLRSDK